MAFLYNILYSSIVIPANIPIMMKTLFIALAILLAIPNFIKRDINEQVPYNNKERYNASLGSINSIDKLEQYVDKTAGLKKIRPGSDEYTALLVYIISCRFYHGFSHWKLHENWIAAIGQKLTGIGLACKVQPDEIMKHPNAACSQQALVMMEILRRKNMPYRKVGFPHHYAIEVKMDGQWYYFDPNMEPKIPFAQRSHEQWKGNNDHLKQFYTEENKSNLDYQFGKGETAQLGPVNEVPAKNARIFQGLTAVLSKCLWCVPLILAFVKRRRPYMYAVKPVNKNYTPAPTLRPLYYA